MIVAVLARRLPMRIVRMFDLEMLALKVLEIDEAQSVFDFFFVVKFISDRLEYHLIFIKSEEQQNIKGPAKSDNNLIFEWLCV